MLTVRIGCDLAFECQFSTTTFLMVMPHRLHARPLVAEQIEFSPGLEPEQFTDTFGNIIHRVTFAPGVNRIRHDALVRVPAVTDREEERNTQQAELSSAELLRYILPSRYCDSDKLMDFAWQHFGEIRSPHQRVQAICDWVHDNIEYRTRSGRPDISAWEIIERGYGVCRDFAHCVVALCRTFNLPARYVSGHLPDIGYQDPGSPMDFHAYTEIFFDGRWNTFDARFNVPRIGRIKVAQGLDAVECALSTSFGQASLVKFEVWAYQVAWGQVSVGDPIDISKRLDGTPRIILAEA